MLYDIDGRIVCNCPSAGTYTDAQCSTAFLELMAKKAALLGMSGTNFASPSGLLEGSYSTPQDLLKLGMAAAANPTALEIWSHPDDSFSIGGSNARTISVLNNVVPSDHTSAAYTDLGQYYDVLGGKGGSLTTQGYARAAIKIVDIEGSPVMVALMATGQTAYNNILKSTKELCDMVKASMTGGAPTAGTNLNRLVTDGGGYAACPVPTCVGAYLNQIAPSAFLSRENAISGNPTAQRIPASTSKTMTMLCALDYITDLNNTILTVKESDNIGGSGSTFYAGDTVRFIDAMHIMMMESSNTMATAIGRYVGAVALANAELV